MDKFVGQNIIPKYLNPPPPSLSYIFKSTSDILAHLVLYIYYDKFVSARYYILHFGYFALACNRNCLVIGVKRQLKAFDNKGCLQNVDRQLAKTNVCYGLQVSSRRRLVTARSDVQQQNRDSTFKLAKACASDYTVPYFPKSKYEAAIYNGVGLLTEVQEISFTSIGDPRADDNKFALIYNKTK